MASEETTGQAARWIQWTALGVIAAVAYYAFAAESREVIERENPRRRKNRARARKGSYREVMVVHGRDGFAVPEKAPQTGSFPLYPIKRARYALTVVASPVYDAHPEVRAQVIRAAVREHPSLRSHAASVRRTVAKRMK